MNEYNMIVNDVLINEIPKYLKVPELVQYKYINDFIDQNVENNFDGYETKMTKIFLDNLENVDKLKLLIKLYPDINFDFGHDFAFLYCSHKNLFDTYKFLDNLTNPINKSTYKKSYIYFLINKNIDAIKWFVDLGIIDKIIDHDILEIMSESYIQYNNIDYFENSIQYLIEQNIINVEDFEIEKKGIGDILLSIIPLFKNINVLKLILKFHNFNVINDNNFRNVLLLFDLNVNNDNIFDNDLENELFINNLDGDNIFDNDINNVNLENDLNFNFNVFNNINLSDFVRDFKVDIVKYFIENGYEININNMTINLFDITENDVDDLNYVVDIFGDKINLKNSIKNGNLQSLKWYYDNYKNEFDDEFVNTVFKLAFLRKDIQIMKFLINIYSNILNTITKELIIDPLNLQIDLIINLDIMKFLFENLFNTSIESLNIEFLKQIYNSNETNLFIKNKELLACLCSMLGLVDELKYLINFDKNILEHRDLLFVNTIHCGQLDILKYLSKVFPINEQNDNNFLDIFNNREMLRSNNVVDINFYEFLFKEYYSIYSQFNNYTLYTLLENCSVCNDVELLKLINRTFCIDFFNNFNIIFSFSFTNGSFDVMKYLLEMEPRFIRYVDPQSDLYILSLGFFDKYNMNIDDYIFINTIDKEKYYSQIDN